MSMHLLECAVCLERYKDPQLLSQCGHTFCRACVAGLRSRQCPTCRTSFGSGDVKANFALQDALQIAAAVAPAPPASAPPAYAPPASAPPASAVYGNAATNGSSVEPWDIPAQPVYGRGLGEASANEAMRGVAFAPPEYMFQGSQSNWYRRLRTLRDWGTRREAEMQRPPAWCMDQLISGTGLYPPRLLKDSWFSPEELGMISRLEGLLAPTGHAAVLARDIMALRLYDVDVRIVVDDSGSMSLSMLQSAGYGGWTGDRVQQVFGARAFEPGCIEEFASCPFGPGEARWTFLQDALMSWEQVFQIMGVRRKLYCLNARPNPEGSVQDALRMGPSGGTPMGATFQRVLQDFQLEKSGRPLLILGLTDGEASDKNLFNQTLDQIQDGFYGDVQVCLLGLSLEKEDIEWFEDEECDDTRIRTIEPFEVEQQQILWRKVIPHHDHYNFSMHTFRALVTNFFPGDYDYEAPIQTLRHRLYITLHAIDRRLTGCRDNNYSTLLWLTHPLDALAALFGQSQLLCAQTGDVASAGVTDAYYEELFGGEGDSSESDSSEGDATSRAIGTLLENLQAMCACAPGEQRYRTATRVDQRVLRGVQCAIGSLQPSEVVMRDLQFNNAQDNKQVLKTAIGYLRQAAQYSGQVGARRS